MATTKKDQTVNRSKMEDQNGKRANRSSSSLGQVVETRPRSNTVSLVNSPKTTIFQHRFTLIKYYSESSHRDEEICDLKFGVCVRSRNYQD